jgi:hypothetical protein
MLTTTIARILRPIFEEYDNAILQAEAAQRHAENYLIEWIETATRYKDDATRYKCSRDDRLTLCKIELHRMEMLHDMVYSELKELKKEMRDK